jgi:hypothetical protein
MPKALTGEMLADHPEPIDKAALQLRQQSQGVRRLISVRWVRHFAAIALYNHANLRGERYAGNLASCAGGVKHIDTRVGLEREIDSFSVEKRVASGDKKRSALGSPRRTEGHAPRARPGHSEFGPETVFTPAC